MNACEMIQVASAVNRMNQMIDTMPEHMRATMRDIVFRKNRGVYRDQQYVVAECQSLASQLNAYAKLMETVNASADHRGN